MEGRETQRRYEIPPATGRLAWRLAALTTDRGIIMSDFFGKKRDRSNYKDSARSVPEQNEFMRRGDIAASGLHGRVGTKARTLPISLDRQQSFGSRAPSESSQSA